MVLADFYRIIEIYLNTDQPTLQTAIVEVRAFCRNQQMLNEIHAFSARGDHQRQNSPGLVIDVQTTPNSSTHQLFFSEAGWMGHTATNPLVSDTSTPKTEPQDTDADAYDRAMGGV